MSVCLLNYFPMYPLFCLKHNSKFILLHIMKCISFVCLIFKIEINTIIALLLHYKISHFKNISKEYLTA